jgi:hypothetical protein
MDFKLVSKNNMGVVITLILVILLSQSRFFDFLIDTHLGRMVLLAFVILIAYANKILGLVAVLFIIIAFNNNEMNMVHSYNYYEGFDVSGNTVSTETAKDKIKDKIETAVQTKMNNNDTTTTTSSAVSGSETFKGREGFNMTDRELNILRGKQSNSVPVLNNAREQINDISPSDKSVFTSDYATF